MKPSPPAFDEEALKRQLQKLERFKVPVILVLVLVFFGGPIFSLLNLFFTRMDPIIVFLVIVGVIILASIRQINQYERGVKFTIGKYAGTMEPGWRLVVPVF